MTVTIIKLSVIDRKQENRLGTQIDEKQLNTYQTTTYEYKCKVGIAIAL